MESMVMGYSFWSGKKVVVTGHTGFKGSWLTTVLIEYGAEVIGISLEPNEDQTLFTSLKLKERIRSHNIIDIRNRTY